MLLSFNHYWRIFAAGISYILFGVGAFLPGVYIFCLALIPMDEATKQRRVRNVIKRLCRFYVNLMQFLGLFSYSVELPNRQQSVGFMTTPISVSGHLVIANHSMLIDALFIMGYVDNICCVVKRDLCTNFFTRLPIRLAGFIPNDDRYLVDRAKRKLDAGENVLIFPEGTRNKHDLQLDFRRGAANIAVVSHAPILPIVLAATPRVLCKGDSWYQLPKVTPVIVLRVNTALPLSDCVDFSLPRTRQYRNLTDYWREYYRTEITELVNQSTSDNDEG